MDRSAHGSHFPTFALYWARVRARGSPRYWVTPRPVKVVARVLIVITAIVAAGAGVRWNYVWCMSQSFRYEVRASHLWIHGQRDRLAGEPVYPETLQAAVWADAMTRKYQWAARVPGLILIPDPPEPGR